MSKKQTPPAAAGLLKNLLSNKATGLAIAAGLGLLGFMLALQLAGLSSSAEGDKSTLAEGRITFHTDDWYGSPAVFFELTGEHSVVAFGKLHSPKKHTCESVRHVRYFDLYKAPTRPEPIYDENGVFIGLHEELEPARQSGSYKNTWGGHFCMMVVWDDYRESPGYGSFYGPFTAKKGLVEQQTEPEPPSPPPRPAPAFSLSTSQRISPDGTRIRASAKRSGSATIASWKYLVVDAADVTINDSEDCQAIFGGGSAGSVLISKRAMIKQGANAAYADIPPRHAGTWICFKAVDGGGNAVYSFARLIQHPDSGADRRDSQTANPDNDAGDQRSADPVAEEEAPAEAESDSAADQDARHDDGNQPAATPVVEEEADAGRVPVSQVISPAAESEAVTGIIDSTNQSDASSGLPSWLVVVVGLAAAVTFALVFVVILSTSRKQS